MSFLYLIQNEIDFGSTSSNKHSKQTTADFLSLNHIILVANCICNLTSSIWYSKQSEIDFLYNAITMLLNKITQTAT